MLISTTTSLKTFHHYIYRHACSTHYDILLSQKFDSPGMSTYFYFLQCQALSKGAAAPLDGRDRKERNHLCQTIAKKKNYLKCKIAYSFVLLCEHSFRSLYRLDSRTHKQFMHCSVLSFSGLKSNVVRYQLPRYNKVPAQV